MNKMYKFLIALSLGLALSINGQASKQNEEKSAQPNINYRALLREYGRTRYEAHLAVQAQQTQTASALSKNPVILSNSSSVIASVALDENKNSDDNQDTDTHPTKCQRTDESDASEFVLEASSTNPIISLLFPETSFGIGDDQVIRNLLSLIDLNNLRSACRGLRHRILRPSLANSKNHLLQLFSENGDDLGENQIVLLLDLNDLAHCAETCRTMSRSARAFMQRPSAEWCQNLPEASAGKLLTRFRGQNNAQMVQTIVLNPKLLLQANLINDLLIWAADNGHQLFVAFLINHKITQLLIDAYSVNSALQLAAGNGHQTILVLLINHKITQPLIEAFSINEALRQAAANGHHSTVEFLINHEITQSRIDANNVNWALESAAKNGHQSFLKLLINHEITQPLIKAYGVAWTLRSAAQNGNQSIVAFLTNHEITQPLINTNGVNWALRQVASNGHQAIVDLLINHKITQPLINADGVNEALQYAAENGHQTIVDLLINHKITQPLINADGVNEALQYAAENGHQAIVDLLKAFKNRQS